MKAGLIIGFLGLALIQPMQKGQAAQSPKNHQQIEKKESPPKAQSSQQTELTTPCPCSEKTRDNNQPLPEKKAGYWKEAFGLLALANWILVIVGIGATIAALLTLQIIRQQVGAMVNSERAWVKAELVPVCIKFGNDWHRPVGNGWAALTDGEMLDFKHLIHSLKLTNMGRTPATILEFELGHSPLGDQGINGPIGEIVKDMDNKEFDRVIAGGESIQETPININDFVHKSIIKAGDSDKFVGFYGLIKYQHVFSDIDIVELRFRYIYSPFTQQLTRISQSTSGEAKGQQRPN